MPRDQLRALIAQRIDANRETIRGEILTLPRLVIYDTANQSLPVVDVLLAGVVIVSAVPIAANNHELLYALPGSPVRVQRSATGRLEVVGLDKRGIGNTYTYTVSMTPLTATSSMTVFVITSGATSGFTTRVLTYGQLASATSGGYGTTPYGAMGLFNAAGSLVNLVA